MQERIDSFGDVGDESLIDDQDAFLVALMPIRPANGTEADHRVNWDGAPWLDHSDSMGLSRPLNERLGLLRPSNPQQYLFDLVQSIFREPDLVPGVGWETRYSVANIGTLEAFVREVRTDLVNFLQGDLCHFKLSSTYSVDNDEAFLRINLNVKGREAQAAQMLAKSLKLNMPLSNRAYEKASNALSNKEADNMAMPTTRDGVKLPAYAPYMPGDSFETFRDVDVIRIMMKQIYQHINVNALKSGHVISDLFVVHKYSEKSLLQRTWLLHCGLPPHDLPGKRQGCDDLVRDYFGEEHGFCFFFITSYVRALVLPAIAGLVMVCPGQLGLSKDHERMSHVVFAVFLSIWSVIFVRNYQRQEFLRIVKWGAENGGRDPLVRILPTYREALDDAPSTLAWTVFSALTLAMFLALIICLVALIQMLQISTITSPRKFLWLAILILKPVEQTFPIIGHWSDYDALSVVQMVGPRFCAILIFAQIQLMDFVWVRLVDFLVTKENPRTSQRAAESKLSKTFYVRLFNTIYPYFYTGFVKRYTVGCSESDGGCIGELQFSLLTYFCFDTILTISALIFDWYTVRRMISSEKRKVQKAVGIVPDYTYMQVQAKLDSDEGGALNESMLRLMIQFVFVCSFTIAWPPLPAVAFVTNFVVHRLLGYQYLNLRRRPYPTLSEGIGPFRKFLRFALIFSCAMNAGFVSFGMNFQSLSGDLIRMKVFVVYEHAMLMLNYAATAIFPVITAELCRLIDFNHEHVHFLMNPLYKRTSSGLANQRLSPVPNRTENSSISCANEKESTTSTDRQNSNVNAFLDARLLAPDVLLQHQALRYHKSPAGLCAGNLL